MDCICCQSLSWG